VGKDNQETGVASNKKEIAEQVELLI